MHRLDRDTSGLLVVAKTERGPRGAARRRCRRREITREYLALVEGRPPARTGTIDAPIGRDRRVRTRMSTDTDDPREARTHFEIAEALPAYDAAAGARWRPAARTRSACTCRRSATRSPATPSTATPGLLGLERQFLHAARLAFAHPVTGAPVDVESAAARRPGRGAAGGANAERLDVARATGNGARTDS